MRKPHLTRRLVIVWRQIKNNLARFPVRRLHRIHDAGARLRGNREPIHQHKYRLFKPNIQQRFRRGKFEYLPVLIKPVETRFAQVEQASLKLLGEPRVRRRGFLRLARANRLLLRFVRRRRHLQRKHYLHSRLRIQREHRIRNLVDCVFLHLTAAIYTISTANPRKQQPQIVVNLGCRRHGRPRISRRILLPDRHRWRDAFDRIHIGFLDSLQKLSRISRQRLHVPPLPLGIYRVEGQRRLAGARDPSHDSQRIVHHLKIDTPQVMHTRAANNNAFRS